MKITTERIVIIAQLLIIVLFWFQVNIPFRAQPDQVEQPLETRSHFHDLDAQDPPPPYRTDINIWPYPSEYRLVGAASVYRVTNWKDFRFVFDASNEILQDAIARYTKLSFWDEKVPSTPCESCVVGLTVTVADARETVPSLDMDESYELTLNPATKMFTLTSKSTWGALRGLETFSQLILLVDGAYVIKETPIVVKDSPRFKWRGLLLDTSRHFFRVSTILKTLDALSYNKMNVLHWHVTDAHSFPMHIPQYPKLSEAGSFRKDAVYSEGDVKMIVEYARKRGIRVMFEWDVPAHTHSWGLAYPITAKCPPKWADINWTPVNPAINLTYEVIDAIFDHTFKLGPDQFIHIGGDEVEKECWSLENTIREFMRERSWAGTDGYDRLQAYFFQRLEGLYRKHRRIPVVWDELLMNQKHYDLPKDMVVEAWRSHDIMIRSLQRGFKTILAAGNYLDVQSPSLPRKYRYRWIDVWRDFYENEPFRGFAFTPEQRANMLGLEAAMWTEQVDDINLDSRVWPRTSAMAERAWSPQYVNVTAAARWRLNFQRCIMVRRGIDGGPSEPDLAGRHICDSTFDRKSK